MDNIKRYSLLGVELDALTIPALNDLVVSAIAANDCWIIGNHNLHSIYLYYHDEQMRRFYANTRYVHIDGMSLVLMGRILGYPLTRINRITYVDWIRPLLIQAEERGWRVFYVGSKPAVVEQGRQVLQAKFPRLQFELRHGYFDIDPVSKESEDVLEQIRAFRPHILMVGMGMPRQEHWILDLMENLPANIVLDAGACLDYLAGAVPTPPRWIARIGLEWLYRLICEPKRLWKRYLIEPWYLGGLLLRDFWRLRVRRLSSTK